jgi:hypothetical protein
VAYVDGDVPRPAEDDRGVSPKVILVVEQSPNPVPLGTGGCSPSESANSPAESGGAPSKPTSTAAANTSVGISPYAATASGGGREEQQLQLMRQSRLDAPEQRVRVGAAKLLDGPVWVGPEEPEVGVGERGEPLVGRPLSLRPLRGDRGLLADAEFARW